ncbi:MAG: isopentenyl phosphate kinase family protein [Thaumarchaeota archaeon]|nr:isopentenyl phosphate kinase family protein [Nitrososphaerota archaeon]
MGRELVVVKLGGSVVTDKSKPFSYRRKVVAALGRAMAASGQRIVLVHGGGSFGHPVAKHYGLSSSPSRSTAEGVSRTREAMFRLNQLVCASLTQAGLHPFTFAPFTLLRNARSAARWVDALLDSNLMPVTFGDVIPDDRGFRIMSGDTICLELSRLLRPRRCVFAFNVDGILDGNGKLIKEVDASVLKQLRKSRADDATGGILLKVTEALKIVSRETDVSFVSGFSTNNFCKALKGRRFHGSVVKVS